jgi:hypothetical protein
MAGLTSRKEHMRSARRIAAAGGIYSAVAFLMFGRAVARDMTHHVVGDGLADKTL